jgi:hypothetical protein
MKHYLIRRDYIVEAENRIEARQIFSRAFAHDQEDEFLVQIKISETDQKGNIPSWSKNIGWRSLLKDQLVGNLNAKR